MAQAKGTTMISPVSLLLSDRQRASEILPASLHRYLDERIRLSAWYPETHLLELIRAGARMLEGDPETTLRALGRAVAQEQLSSQVQEEIQDEASNHDDPLALPRRALALWSSQHDSGQMKMRIDGEGRGALELLEFGLPSEEMCAMVTGYLNEVLCAAGLRDPRVSKTACRMDGEASCEWRFTWS